MEVSPTAPATDAEPSPRILPTKPLTFTNGVLKRHPSIHHHHRHVAPPPVAYKECLKNHAAAMGGHALDGCGEFMPSPTATPTDPTSLKCAACGCHRNFHRRDPDEPVTPAPPPPSSSVQHVIEYQPHHRHHPPPPPPPPRCGNSSPDSPSPPPISSSYYPSAPHMLLALSAGLSGQPIEKGVAVSPNLSSGRKRFRTRFSQDQKVKMYEFAEKVGWKIQRRDEERISEFCSEVGVDRGVLKVWMHNNKNTLGRKETTHNSNGNGVEIGNGNGGEQGNDNSYGENRGEQQHHHNNDISNVGGIAVVGANGCSSSS